MKHPTRFEMVKEICEKLEIKYEATKPPVFDSCGEIHIDGKWYEIQAWWSLKATMKKVHEKICKQNET